MIMKSGNPESGSRVIRVPEAFEAVSLTGAGSSVSWVLSVILTIIAGLIDGHTLGGLGDGGSAWLALFTA